MSHPDNNPDPADFEVSNHGSITLLHPATQGALDWIDSRIDSKAQPWNGSIVVEPRYLPAILDAIARDGLTIGDA